MPKCRPAAAIDPVLPIASRRAILPGPRRWPVAKSSRRVRRVVMGRYPENLRILQPNQADDNRAKAFGYGPPARLFRRRRLVHQSTAWADRFAPIPTQSAANSQGGSVVARIIGPTLG